VDGDCLKLLDGVAGRDLLGVIAADAGTMSRVRGERSGSGGFGILDGVKPGVLAAERGYIFLGV
jgi:hypothetical protein